jgi:RNA ligase (TIGR02306 family)
MNITYERNVEHCEVTPYIKDCTIKEVRPANNADALDIVNFEELGWQSVVKRDSLKVGDKVVFLVPETILPFEMSEEMEVTKYLSKGKVRVTTLRGNRSAGLLADRKIIDKYIDFILRWEDPPGIALSGEALAIREVNPNFHKFYKMPNILNEPDTFKLGETVFFSEKIHGTNFRFGCMQHPTTEEYINYVGSHEVILKENESNTYWRVFNKNFKNIIPTDLLFFAEIAGCGIQKGFDYGSKREPFAKVFAITREAQYLSVHEVKTICQTYNLPHVEFHELTYNGLDTIQSLADSDSELTTEHIREGIVLVSSEYPDRMAKCISFYYLEGKDKKGKKIKTTEFH